MTIDEARRIAALQRKMQETTHRDEATAVMTQLNRMAERRRVDPERLVEEAESLLDSKVEHGPLAGQPMHAAAGRRRRMRIVGLSDDFWSLVRDRPAWQDILALIFFAAIVYGVMIMALTD